MGAPAIGSVVLVPFPFSDLSQSKRRPAVVLAPAERGDWILCQITSKPYAAVRAVPLTDADLTLTSSGAAWASPATPGRPSSSPRTKASL